MKRILSLSFVALSTLLLLVLAVAPHHHHDGAMCIMTACCEAESVPHHGDEPHGAVPGNTTDNSSCVAKSNYLVPGSQSELKSGGSTSADHPHDLLFCSCFLVAEILTLSPCDSPLPVEYGNDGACHTSTEGLPQRGLRAPPAHLS